MPRFYLTAVAAVAAAVMAATVNAAEFPASLLLRVKTSSIVPMSLTAP